MVITRRQSGILLAAVAVCAAQDSYALIAGTVFRPNGTAFPGIEVLLTPDPDPDPAAKRAKKYKPQRLVSSPRGEFAFRVPAKPMRYTLSVKSSGYKPLTKTVQVAGDERQDVSLMLEAGS